MCHLDANLLRSISSNSLLCSSCLLAALRSSQFGPVGGQGKYPDKIVKRLKNEAKKYAIEKNLPSSVISLKPEDKRNKGGINVFWLGEISGPKDTIYDRSTIMCELFVSPEYPFKGPTLQYEGHVVEFVVGKNQTDPREANIQSPWAPAMTLMDAVLRVETLLIEQQKKIEAEQRSLELKRQEKLKMEEHQKAMEKLAKEEEEEEGEDINDPLYIPPFGVPSPKKADGTKTPPKKSPMNTPPKKGSLDAKLAEKNFADSPSTKNPLAIETGETDTNIEHDDNFDDDNAVEEPTTPVVKLGKSEALPRRGSFRHSFTQGNSISMGLDIDKLLSDEGIKDILDETETEDK